MVSRTDNQDCLGHLDILWVAFTLLEQAGNSILVEVPSTEQIETLSTTAQKPGFLASLEVTVLHGTKKDLVTIK